MPPPRVKPATPVVEINPPVLARPWAAVALSKSAQVAPGSTLAVQASKSTVTPRSGGDGNPSIQSQQPPELREELFHQNVVPGFGQPSGAVMLRIGIVIMRSGSRIGNGYSGTFLLNPVMASL